MIRQTRDNPKPIRVFLQDGENDINLAEGNWTLANLQMDSALSCSPATTTASRWAPAATT